MKTVIHIGLLMLGLFTMFSCRTVYVPNAVNVPLLQEKGEIKATIASNNLQAAYAASDHIGVIANGYLNAYTSDDKTFKNHGKGAELGIGYFGQTEHRISYETYAGAGLYNVRIKESNNTRNFNADAFKYFIQPAIGWVHPFFEIAVSPRLAFVKYSKPTLSGYTVDEQTANYFDVLNEKTHIFLEPTLVLRGGYKFVKIQVQVGRSFKLSKNNINYDNSIGSVGLIFDIAQWYKTDQDK